MKLKSEKMKEMRKMMRNVLQMKGKNCCFCHDFDEKTAFSAYLDEIFLKQNQHVSIFFDFFSKMTVTNRIVVCLYIRKELGCVL